MEYYLGENKVLYIKDIKTDPSYRVVEKEDHEFFVHDGSSLAEREESLPSLIEYRGEQYPVFKEGIRGGYPGDFVLVIEKR